MIPVPQTTLDDSNPGEFSDSSDPESGPESGESGRESSDDEEGGTMRHTGPLFRSRKLDKPVYDGSRLTLKQYLLRLLQHTAEGKVSLTSLAKDLHFQSAQGLPAGNLLPATTYKLFDLLGIDIDRFERHACVGGCVAFAPLDPKEYLQHVDEKCKVCKEPRFERRGQAVSPRKKFYYIPLAMQVELLKRQEGFDSSMERMADDIRQGKTTPYNSFWGAKLARQVLNEKGMFDNFTKILVLSLGLDGVRCFKNGSYSVWPIGVKFWNLHGEDRTRKEYILLASLVPGPAPPAKLDAFLAPVLDEIKQSKTGMPFLSSLARVTWLFFIYFFIIFFFGLFIY